MVLDYTNFFVHLTRKIIAEWHRLCSNIIFPKSFLLSRYICHLKFICLVQKEKKKKSEKTLPINTEQLFISLYFLFSIFSVRVFFNNIIKENLTASMPVKEQKNTSLLIFLDLYLNIYEQSQHSYISIHFFPDHV